MPFGNSNATHAVYSTLKVCKSGARGNASGTSAARKNGTLKGCNKGWSGRIEELHPFRVRELYLMTVNPGPLGRAVELQAFSLLPVKKTVFFYGVDRTPIL